MRSHFVFPSNIATLRFLCGGGGEPLRFCVSRRSFFAATDPLWKRSGKPTEVGEYKQVYDPSATPATNEEIQRERRRFSTQPHFRGGKPLDVKDVPDNMFRYGKEGMSVPIAIFKDQPDPVIAAEHTYPGIFENKIAARVVDLSELCRKFDEDKLDSPWQRDAIDSKVKKGVGTMAQRMRKMRWRQTLRERGDPPTRKGATPSAGTGAAKGSEAAPASAPPKPK